MSNGGGRGRPSPFVFEETHTARESPSGAVRWRVLNDPPLPGHTNMARDHALAVSLRPWEGVFRLYRWDPATISFGRNEPARGLYSEERAREAGVAFVRRPTGGRAVLHDAELTYCLTFPLGTFGGLRKAYRVINQGLLAGLRGLGAQAELATDTGPNLPPDAGPCFRQPAEGEVMALGRKLIGSAQVRVGGSVLQHGSIILGGNQELLGRLRMDGEPVPPPGNLRELLGDLPSPGVLAESLIAGMAATVGGIWEEDGWREEERMAAGKLEGHYLDPEWTWRS